MQATTAKIPYARSWALGLALIAAATAGGLLLEHRISLTSQAMLYVLAVVLAAYRLTPLPSVLCAVGAVTAFNFFFVPPRWTFAVDDQEHVIALLVMLAVALVISHLTAKLRQESASADASARRAQQLQTLATELAIAPDAAAVLALGQTALDAAFPGPSTLATPAGDGRLEFAGEPQPHLSDGLRSCMREAATLGPGTGRWPGLNAWYLPLGSKGQMQGALCIENISAADQLGREHAQALCALLAQTLARLQMAAAIQASQAEVQRQQLQSTFLAAISHDLRTPLAAVLGAATALQSQADKLGAQEQQRLLESIVREARYLSSVTENTLQLVQLSNTAHPLQRGWESMEEIVGTVLGRMRLRDPGHRISAQVPKDLPLIEADPVLLAQLLSNLLDNALQYSPGPIALQVQTTPTQMQVRVKDSGDSIAPAQYSEIFRPYARGVQGDQGGSGGQAGPRGAGLGLALCRAIASAHGGSLGLSARPGGGNCFALTLPLSAQQPLADTAVAGEAP